MAPNHDFEVAIEQGTTIEGPPDFDSIPVPTLTEAEIDNRIKQGRRFLHERRNYGGPIVVGRDTNEPATVSPEEQAHVDALEARLNAGEGWKGMKTVGAPQIHADVKNIVHGYPHIAPSLPEGIPGCDYDRRGFAIIRDRAHERSVGAMLGMKRS